MRTEFFRFTPAPPGRLNCPMLFQRLCCLAALTSSLFISGCSTTAMKGTPFYTGEYSRRQGPVEQRVNIWPVLYYREPALSVLWPMFELTDEHIAIRPLFSVYGLDQTNHQYNILWPLARFDRRTDDSWTFPVFWSDSHIVLFPLYWHYGEPWGPRGGSDSLFPLWVLSRKEDDYSRLWSLWPLVRVWSDRKDNTDGSMVFPLYWHRSDNRGSEFYSPHWLARRRENGDYWQCLPPLYFQADNNDFSSLVTPLWAQGHSGAENWKTQFPLWYYHRDGSGGHDLFAPFPLVRVWSDGNGRDRGSMVLPLYCHVREGENTRFFSLPWCSDTRPDGGWRLLVPLFYQSSDAARSTLITPLWAQGRAGETDWQMATLRPHSSPGCFRGRQPVPNAAIFGWPAAWRAPAGAKIPEEITSCPFITTIRHGC